MGLQTPPPSLWPVCKKSVFKGFPKSYPWIQISELPNQARLTSSAKTECFNNKIKTRIFTSTWRPWWLLEGKWFNLTWRSVSIAESRLWLWPTDLWSILILVSFSMFSTLSLSSLLSLLSSFDLFLTSSRSLTIFYIYNFSLILQCYLRASASSDTALSLSLLSLSHRVRMDSLSRTTLELLISDENCLIQRIAGNKNCIINCIIICCNPTVFSYDKPLLSSIVVHLLVEASSWVVWSLVLRF